MTSTIDDVIAGTARSYSPRRCDGQNLVLPALNNGKLATK